MWEQEVAEKNPDIAAGIHRCRDLPRLVEGSARNTEISTNQGIFDSSITESSLTLVEGGRAEFRRYNEFLGSYGTPTTLMPNNTVTGVLTIINT